MKKGWQTKRLGDVCEIIKGRKPALKATATNGDLPYLVAKVMRGSKEAEYASVKDRNSITVEESETIIICDGSNSGEVFTGFRGILSSTMGKIAKKAEIDDDYLRAFLASTFDVFNGAKTGAAIPHLDKEGMYQLQFPFPPLAEQQRIVGLLDEAFEGLATAKANAEKNLQNARALFESGLDSAITGKLTRERRHKHKKIGNASADLAGRLTVRRKQWTGTGKYREPDAPVTLKPIDVPDGWVLASPEQITTHIVDCPHSTPKWAESGVLCLRTTNFKPGFLDLESVRFVSQQTYKERIMRLEPQPGDVLFSREGGILGIACMIPEKLKTCLGQRMMLFRADATLVLPEYFTAVLNSTLIISEVKRLTGGAASPHLNICDIRTFPIPLPPITEQRQIVAKLNTIAAETQNLARLYERKLAALAELKKSLLHQAFTGEL